MKIYRAPEMEDRFDVAADLGVLDVGYYKRLASKLNDPKLRLKVSIVLVFGGMCLNSAFLGVLLGHIL